MVGMGQVKSHGDGSRELASIAVLPKRQGQHIGTAVINALLAREAGVVLHLSCRRELEGYYERFGFRRNWHSASEGLGPERHLGYALQWWGFAALTVFLYVFLNLERRSS